MLAGISQTTIGH